MRQKLANVIHKPNSTFSVGKIICVGLNYNDHISEMTAEKPLDPVLFLKPSTAILHEDRPIKLPSYSNNVHHEIELALLIKKKAKFIKVTTSGMKESHVHDVVITKEAPNYYLD